MGGFCKGNKERERGRNGVRETGAESFSGSSRNALMTTILSRLIRPRVRAFNQEFGGQKKPGGRKIELPQGSS